VDDKAELVRLTFEITLMFGRCLKPRARPLQALSAQRIAPRTFNQLYIRRNPIFFRQMTDSATSPSTTTTPPLTIDIVSDNICPWYVVVVVIITICKLFVGMPEVSVC